VIRIFRVTTTLGDVWESCASSFDSACAAACKAFNCPSRAIVSIEVVKIVE